MSDLLRQDVLHLLTLMNERMDIFEKCMDDVVEMNKALEHRLSVVEVFILNGDAE